MPREAYSIGQVHHCFSLLFFNVCEYLWHATRHFGLENRLGKIRKKGQKYIKVFEDATSRGIVAIEDILVIISIPSDQRLHPLIELPISAYTTRHTVGLAKLL